MSLESPSRNPPEPENEGEKGHGSSVANPSPEGGLASSNLSPVAEVKVELHSERGMKMRLDRSVSLKPPLPPNEKAAASSSKSNLSSQVEILRDKPPFEIPVPRPRNPLREGKPDDRDEFVCLDMCWTNTGPEMPMSQLTQEEVQNEIEEERWDYNENLSPVRVTGT
ncbi:hypothetical protein SASPL_106787 [Salvia splendens]|uniref:Uncharacterized protein n=1 Tax=Salvia splendens TaxID=180675 RepID=A0A8X8YEW8_SALSN|nr:hypothetical protein SASPL_106787 [Salvia splendens]